MGKKAVGAGGKGFCIPEDCRFGSLRALRAKDANGMLEWMHDPSIASVFKNDFLSMQLKDVESFIESTHEASNSIHFAVVDDNDEYMGTVSLKCIDVENGDAEYAISMRSIAHGKGFSKAGTLDVLRYAFEVIGLHRVYLNVRSDNVRAARFYEKIGFKHEGTARDALNIGGRFRDLDWYAMLSTDCTAILNP